MDISKPLPLQISDSDLNSHLYSTIEKSLLSTRTLGEQESANRKIVDLLPSVIAERIRAIIPPDFELGELEIKFDIQGKLFGTGIGGEVIAKLRKRG